MKKKTCKLTLNITIKPLEAATSFFCQLRSQCGDFDRVFFSAWLRLKLTPDAPEQTEHRSINHTCKVLSSSTPGNPCSHCALFVFHIINENMKTNTFEPVF